MCWIRNQRLVPWRNGPFRTLTVHGASPPAMRLTKELCELGAKNTDGDTACVSSLKTATFIAFVSTHWREFFQQRSKLNGKPADLSPRCRSQCVCSSRGTNTLITDFFVCFISRCISVSHGHSNSNVELSLPPHKYNKWNENIDKTKKTMKQKCTWWVFLMKNSFICAVPNHQQVNCLDLQTDPEVTEALALSAHQSPPPPRCKISPVLALSVSNPRSDSLRPTPKNLILDP